MVRHPLELGGLGVILGYRWREVPLVRGTRSAAGEECSDAQAREEAAHRVYRFPHYWRFRKSDLVDPMRRALELRIR